MLITSAMMLAGIMYGYTHSIKGVPAKVKSASWVYDLSVDKELLQWREE